MDLRNVRSREPSQALLGLYNFTLIRITTMSYIGNSKFYWQDTWFAYVTVLRGGIVAMKR